MNGYHSQNEYPVTGRDDQNCPTHHMKGGSEEDYVRESTEHCYLRRERYVRRSNLWLDNGNGR